MNAPHLFTKDVRDRWVEALKSGRYRQTQNVMYSPSTNSYCCLGVLADLLGVIDECVRRDSNADISPYVLDGLPVDVRTKLIAMNDREGYSFENIANYIENNVPYQVESTICPSTST